MLLSRLRDFLVLLYYIIFALIYINIYVNKARFNSRNGVGDMTPVFPGNPPSVLAWYHFCRFAAVDQYFLHPISSVAVPPLLFCTPPCLPVIIFSSLSISAFVVACFHSASSKFSCSLLDCDPTFVRNGNLYSCIIFSSCGLVNFCAN